MSASTVTRQPARYSQSPVAPTTNTLPPAPGLPARPSFEAPSYNREDMNRMHAGHPTTATGHSVPKKPVKKSHLDEMEDFLKDTKDAHKKGIAEAEAAAQASSEARDQTELVDLIQSAEDRARAAPTAAPTASATPADAATDGKKKKSSKPQQLVYTDNSESPEEKLAKRSNYAFKRD